MLLKPKIFIKFMIISQLYIIIKKGRRNWCAPKVAHSQTIISTFLWKHLSMLYSSFRYTNYWNLLSNNYTTLFFGISPCISCAFKCLYINGTYKIWMSFTAQIYFAPLQFNWCSTWHEIRWWPWNNFLVYYCMITQHKLHNIK